MLRDEVWAEVNKELDRHIVLWGRPDGDWIDSLEKKMTVLAEEFGEIAMALNDHDYDNLKTELVQTMAVAASWLLTEY